MTTSRCIAFVILLCGVGWGAEPEMPLRQLLETDQLPRWRMERALSQWKGPLSPEDLAALSGFVERKQGKDWRLWTAGRRLLRAHGAGGEAVAAEVDAAERLLLEMRGGKVSHDAYDRHLPALVALGRPIVPMLIDLLSYGGIPEDSYAKRAAILALTELDDPRPTPALRDALAREKQQHHFNLLALGLLTRVPTKATADEVAELIAKRGSFDQENNLTSLACTKLNEELVLQLYSHYPSFQEYGRTAVMRGLRQIDNEAALQQLARIVEVRDQYLGHAARALGEMKSGNALPVLQRIFASLNEPEPLPMLPGTDRGEDLRAAMIAVCRRGYVGLVPQLQEIMDRPAERVDAQRVRIVAAGALAFFGVNYDENARQVRSALREVHGSHEIAGFLSDSLTVQALGGEIGRTKPADPNPDFTDQAIGALAQIGNRAALRELGAAVDRVPLRLSQMENLGKAIAAIGASIDDPQGAREGQVIQSVVKMLHAIGHGPPQKGSLPPGPDEAAIEWLKVHPNVTESVLAELLSENGRTNWAMQAGGLLQLLDAAWDARFVPYLEKMLETDTSVRRSSPTTGEPVEYYGIRSEVAGFLTRKTGKTYTYTDIDGAIRIGGEGPR